MIKYTVSNCALFIFFSMLPMKSFAGQCSNVKPNFTISAGTITVQRDQKANTYIGDPIFAEVGNVYSDCTGYASGENDRLGVKTYANSIGTIDGNAIFQSNIPGIGFILGTRATFGSGPIGCSFNNGYNWYILSGQNQFFSCDISSNPSTLGSAWAQPMVRFVYMPTGNVQGGNLTGSLGRIIGGNATQGWLPEVPIMINGTIKISSCSVNTPSVSVNLGDFFTDEFNAVGHTTVSVPVPVNLDCFAGTRINVIVAADSDTNTQQQGAIKLAGGGADGVAIQLLDKNGSGVKLNQKFVVDTTISDGQYNFDWTARYLQTESIVSSGNANGSATLSISYE